MAKDKPKHGYDCDPIVVQKYGGSSVCDTSAIKRVAQRIVDTKKQGFALVVVVSAMGKTTDSLYKKAFSVSKSPSRRELDMLLTCGERESMALLSMAVQELGHEAISLTGSQSGIMTNDRHSGARIIEVRPIRVVDELERGRIVIVAGFQGVSYKREITTLGRGGSDTSAIALAAALKADYCEICSDVDGVYSADPRVVDEAKLLEHLSCDNMLELAAHGAKVLHPGCVEIARRTGIALVARATAKQIGGTRIDLVGQGQNVDTVGISGMKNLVRVRAEGVGCIEKVLKATALAKVPALYLDTDTDSADLWFSLDDVPDWLAVKKQLAKDLLLLEDAGAVSIVGDEIGVDPAKLKDARSIAEKQGVDVFAMTSSPLRLSIYCHEKHVDALMRAMHQHFVEAA